MMDPDFQIRGGGGHLDPEIRGAQSPKKFFLALRASFWSKNKGGAGHSGPPLNPPLSAVALVTVVCVVLALIATTLFTATTLSGGSGGPGPPPLTFRAK